ncbi:amino acid permease [Desulfitobacterium sp. Sab5]|uniref:amino acid permease n=1 Tax=Desulfitobacterium nosdiversum TaxID=3375356 RepID=UPI003CFB3F27
MSRVRNNQEQLKRTLTERHVQMIALGGAIGVGLFYGSSTTIKMAGPAITLGYILGGLIIFIIMRALGEMAVADPRAGSFSAYAYRYVGPFAGFLTGWNYWFLWIGAGMAEITALGIYVNFWFPGVPRWLSALVALIIMASINLINVKAFGEFEFWFAIIKVAAILGMILSGIIIILGIGPGGRPLGFSNLWAHGGFLPNGISGLMLSLVMVMFSFGGVELVGITAGEAQNPEHTIPKAVNNVFWRVLIFYVGAIGVMMAIYPWNEIGSQGSPFVLIFDRIGIPAAATIINGVVITAALSAFNSGLFSTGRMLYNLALQNNAPKMFAQLSETGVPRNGVLISSLIILLVVALNYFIPGRVFIIVSAITTFAVVITWTSILITQLYFRKALSAEQIKQLTFKMPAHKLLSGFALLFLGMILVLMYFIPDMRFALIIGPLWLLLLYISFRMKSAQAENA